MPLSWRQPARRPHRTRQTDCGALASPLTRADHPVPAALVLFARIARLSGFARQLTLRQPGNNSGLVFPQYLLLVRLGRVSLI